MTGVFYGIGVGPGDPELLTLKAIKAIQEADVVLAPKTEKKDESVALAIAKPYLKDGVEVLTMVFPMVAEQETLNSAWEKNRTVIEDLLGAGKKVAFLTLGDPMLYSTYIYLYRLLEESGYPRITIPGIPSFCAAAARAGRPLAEKDEILSIVPAAAIKEDLQDITKLADSLVFLKVSHNFSKTAACLAEEGLLHNSVLVSRCGMTDEEILPGKDGWDLGKVPYLSVILAKKRSWQA